MKQAAINIALGIAAFFLALVIALFIAETITRFVLPAPEQITTNVKPLDFSSITPTSEKKHLSISEHPDQGGLYRGTPTGRRLNPNRIVTIENHRLSKKKVVIETNSLGYRNPEIMEKHSKRILFLGDSITFQDFLNEDETFVRLIEKKSHENNQNWETINSGVGSISLKTELAILLESGLSLQPDVVVLDFYLNDFQESKGVNVTKLPALLNKSWFAYYLINQFSQLSAKMTSHEVVDLKTWQAHFEEENKFSDGAFNENSQAFNTMIKNNFSDYGAAWSQDSWDYMLPLFVDLKRLSIEHHFNLVIVGFPIYQQVYTEFVDDYPQQQVAHIGKQLDIPVLDLLPPLRDEALKLRDPSIYHTQQFYQDLFYDQCHHTPAGSALIADQIYLFLNTPHG